MPVFFSIWIGIGLILSLGCLHYSERCSPSNAKFWNALGWGNFANIVGTLMTVGGSLQIFRFHNTTSKEILFPWLLHDALMLRKNVDLTAVWNQLVWTPSLLLILPLLGVMIASSPTVTRALLPRNKMNAAQRPIYRLSLALVPTMLSIPLFSSISNIDLTGGIYSFPSSSSTGFMRTLFLLLVLSTFFLFLPFVAAIGNGWPIQYPWYAMKTLRKRLRIHTLSCSQCLRMIGYGVSWPFGTMGIQFLVAQILDMIPLHAQNIKRTLCLPIVFGVARSENGLLPWWQGLQANVPVTEILPYLIFWISPATIEILFRGTLSPRLGWYGTLLSTFLYPQQNGSLLLSPLPFVFGLWLGYIARRWNTTAAILVHTTSFTAASILSLALISDHPSPHTNRLAIVSLRYECRL